MSVEILRMKGYNFLWIDDYLWMWDLPAEMEIQQELANQAYGDVLVVGCGLGVVQRMLYDNQAVNQRGLITIEKNPEVYDACWKKGIRVPGGHHVWDFFDVVYDREAEGNVGFDCVIGDIWPEIAPEGLDMYKKFKTKAQEFLKPGGKILAWGQEFFEYLIEKEI